jgi:hypothetical protein
VRLDLKNLDHFSLFPGQVSTASSDDIHFLLNQINAKLK